MTMGNMQSVNLMIWSIAIADVDDFVTSTTWNKCKRVEFLKIRRRKIAYVIPLPVQLFTLIPPKIRQFRQPFCLISQYTHAGTYWKIPLGWNFGGYVRVIIIKSLLGV